MLSGKIWTFFTAPVLAATVKQRFVERGFGALHAAPFDEVFHHGLGSSLREQSGSERREWIETTQLGLDQRGSFGLLADT